MNKVTPIRPEFALTPKVPSIAHQIWTRVRREPQLASGLTTAKLMDLREIRDFSKDAVSAAVTTLAKKGFIVPVGTSGRAIVYGPGPKFADPTLKFGYMVLGGTRDRKPGYKQHGGAKPDVDFMSAQQGLPLGANSTRDETREKNLTICRAIPLDVIEQVLAEKRAAAKETKS